MVKAGVSMLRTTEVSQNDKLENIDSEYDPFLRPLSIHCFSPSNLAHLCAGLSQDY